MPFSLPGPNRISILRGGALLLLLAALAPAGPGAQEPAAESQATKPSAELKAWIEVCAERLASTDPDVRNGATLALSAAGEPARPALERIAQSDDESLAATARRVLGRLDRRSSRPGGGQPGEIARRPAHADRRRASRVRRLTAQLGLDAEQESKVAAIIEAFDGKQREIIEQSRSGGLSRDAAAKRLAALRGELDGELATALTPEQAKRLAALQNPGEASAVAAADQ